MYLLLYCNKKEGICMFGQSTIIRRTITGALKAIGVDEKDAIAAGKVAKWVVALGTLDITGILTDGVIDVVADSVIDIDPAIDNYSITNYGKSNISFGAAFGTKEYYLEKMEAELKEAADYESDAEYWAEDNPDKACGLLKKAEEHLENAAKHKFDAEHPKYK
jgi:hypothetical protein